MPFRGGVSNVLNIACGNASIASELEAAIAQDVQAILDVSVLLTGNQTVAGTKTLTSAIVSPFGTGTNNERFGSGSGGSTCSGNSNVMIGADAGKSMTNTGETVAIGHRAFDAATIFAGGTVAIGQDACGAVTEGFDNTGVGWSALATATTGYANVVLGSGADVAATNTQFAVALGYIAVAENQEFGTGPYVISWTNYGLSSTSTKRKRFSIDAIIVDNTDATRKYGVTINSLDAGGKREGFRTETSGSAPKISFFGFTTAVKQTSGADVTNNVTAGGTTDQLDDFTNLTVYATDAAAIRNDIYQLSRKVKQINDALRLYGLLT